jgi:hypothetical protein
MDYGDGDISDNSDDAIDSCFYTEIYFRNVYSIIAIHYFYIMHIEN